MWFVMPVTLFGKYTLGKGERGFWRCYMRSQGGRRSLKDGRQYSCRGWQLHQGLHISSIRACISAPSGPAHCLVLLE